MSTENKNLKISIKSSIDDGFKKLAKQLRAVVALSNSMTNELIKFNSAQNKSLDSVSKSANQSKQSLDKTNKAIKDGTKATEAKISAVNKEISAEERKAKLLAKNYAALKATETLQRRNATLARASGNVSGYLLAREQQFISQAKRSKIDNNISNPRYVQTTVRELLSSELKKMANNRKDWSSFSSSSIPNSSNLNYLREKALKDESNALKARSDSLTKQYKTNSESALASARKQASLASLDSSLRDSVYGTSALANLINNQRKSSLKEQARNNLVNNVGLGSSGYRNFAKYQQGFTAPLTPENPTRTWNPRNRLWGDEYGQPTMGKADWNKIKKNTDDATASVSRYGMNLRRVADIRVKPPIDTKHLDLLGRFNKSIMKTGELLFRLQYAFITMAGPALGFGILSDQFTELQTNIGRASQSTAEFASGFSDVNRIARETYMNVTAVSKIYSRFAQDANKYNLSQKDVTGLTETVAVLTASSGGNKASAESGLNQFQQAFASDKFGGDELKSVFENSPLLAKAIAAGIQKTTIDKASMGDLRSMASDKKRGVTGKMLVDALSSDEVKAQVLKFKESIIPTFGGAITNLGNTLINLSGRINSQFQLAKKINYLANVADSALFLNKSDYAAQRQAITESMKKGDMSLEKGNEKLAYVNKIEKDSEYLKVIATSASTIVGLMLLDSAANKLTRMGGDTFKKTSSLIAAASPVGKLGPQIPKTSGPFKLAGAVGTDMLVAATNAFPYINNLLGKLGGLLTFLLSPLTNVVKLFGSLYTRTFPATSAGLSALTARLAQFLGRLVFGIPVVGWIIGVIVTLFTVLLKLGTSARFAGKGMEIFQGALYLFSDALGNVVTSVLSHISKIKANLENIGKWSMGYTDSGKKDANGVPILVDTDRKGNKAWGVKVVEGVKGVANRAVKGLGIESFQQKSLDRFNKAEADKAAKALAEQERINKNTPKLGAGFGGAGGIPSSIGKGGGTKPVSDKVDKLGEAITNANGIISDIRDATEELGEDNGYNGFYAEIEKNRNDATRRLKKLFSKINKEVPKSLVDSLNKELTSQEIAKLTNKVKEVTTDNIWSSRSTLLGSGGMSSSYSSLDSQLMASIKNSLGNFPVTSTMAEELNTAASSSSTQSAITNLFRVMQEAVEGEKNADKRTKLTELYNQSIKSATIVMVDFVNTLKSKLRELAISDKFAIANTAFNNNLMSKGVFGKSADNALAIEAINTEQKKYLADNFIKDSKTVEELIGKPISAWIEAATTKLNLPDKLIKKTDNSNTEDTKGMEVISVVGKRLQYKNGDITNQLDEVNKLFDNRRATELENQRMATKQMESYWLGATKAVTLYLDAAKDAASQTADVMSKALSSMEDKLTELLNTGKIKDGLRGFLYGIQTELNRLLVKSFIMPKLIGAISEVLPHIPIIGKIFTKWKDSQSSKLGDNRGSLTSSMIVTAANVYINSNPLSAGGDILSGMVTGHSRGGRGSSGSSFMPRDDLPSGVSSVISNIFKGLLSRLWPILKPSGGSLFAGIFHGGGNVSDSKLSRRVPAAMFGSLKANEVPIIAKSDETILTSSQMSGIRGSLSTPSSISNSSVSFSPAITVNYTGSGDSSKEDAEHMSRLIKESINTQMTDFIVKNRRQGGMLR